MVDPRLLFVVRALHCVAAAGEDLETDEVRGLSQVIEAVVIDDRRRVRDDGD